MIPDGNKGSCITKRLRSFIFAFKGIGTVLQTQPNFRIHLAIATIVLITGILIQLTMTEWCIIVVAISLVLSLEMINTALEFLVDLVSPQYAEKAGKVKDLAAGAVLISAIGAAIVGILIFGQKILNF